jgi:hypothetical protein
LGQPKILAMGNRTEAPGCLIERAVNAALGKAFDEAEALLLARFGEVHLAGLNADVRAHLAKRRKRVTLESAHES